MRLVAWSRSIDPVGCYVWKEAPDGRLMVLLGAVAALAQLDTALHAPALLPEDRTRGLKLCLQADGLLRSYQADAVAAALTAPLGRSILSVGMGGGKTRIAAGLAAVAGALGFPRWLYLVQNTELAKQSEATFREMLPKMEAALGAGGATITGGTFARVAKLEDKAFDGIIVDECHSLPAPTRCLGFARARSSFKVGLSGTALDRQDSHNALTIGLLGPVAYKAQVDELEKEGFLSRGRVERLSFDCRTGRIQRV
jgi:superfamily II DNA or RNA helicase